MNPLLRIVGRLNLLRVRFTDDGAESSTVSYDLLNGKPMRDGRAPVVMVVSGSGVVTKNVSDTGVVAQVTSNPATFVWTVSGEQISFLRRERLAKFENPAVLYVECLPHVDDDALSGVVERFRSQYLSVWRVLSVPPLASFVTKRLMLPVLSVLLLALLMNFMLSGRVDSDFQAASAELAALRKTSSADARVSERRRAMLEEFSGVPQIHAGFLSDRVAAAVPQGVTLSELAIAPLSKVPEKGKPVQRVGDVVVVKGVAVTSAMVDEFFNALEGLRLGTLRLTALERDAETKALNFKIEVEL